MTRKEYERRARLADTLAALGFTDQEAAQLRRIASTLSRWHELKCGTDAGYIERDPTTDKPYMVYDNGTRRSRYPTPDREKGAERRLAAIMANHAPLAAYVQTDPRGAPLYILRPGDVPEGKDPAAYYSRGICVY
jgi:hypothetical protein